MGTPYAKLQSSIWAEESDFRQLPKDAQRVYLVLISQPNISHCGVLPCNPKRWSNLAPDDTIEAMNAALNLLVKKAFIAVETDSDELWVRSWMKYDGLIFGLNGAKAVSRSIDAVLASRLARRIRITAQALAGGMPDPAPGKPDQRPLIRGILGPPLEEVPNPLPNPLPEGTVQEASSNDNYNHSDNDSSNNPLDSRDAFTAALAAALEIRRSQTTVGNPEKWEPKTREMLAKDYGHRIRRELDAGHTPDDAASIALGICQSFNPFKPMSTPHPTSCECDGNGMVYVDDDYSAVKPCPVTEWPEATIHELRRSS